MSFQKTCPELAALLYHGSTIGVSAIDLSLSARGKDFGRGFYTTSRRDQAIKFARLKAKRLGTQYGFVSVFQYTHNPELAIKKFDKADSEWLSFVLKNLGTYGNPQSQEAQETAIRLLDTTKLYNQVFFGTKSAISSLQFKEVFQVGIN
ncbi:hypothetical protein AGMMS49928_23300 [Spirochaetia bacterium]|nr:hypothetical protein AGMMS49928_23300 [Spirochaetia bacterium]